MTDNGKIFGKLDWFSCMFYNTSILHIMYSIYRNINL